jgi:hypothetical protein
MFEAKPEGTRSAICLVHGEGGQAHPSGPGKDADRIHRQNSTQYGEFYSHAVEPLGEIPSGFFVGASAMHDSNWCNHRVICQFVPGCNSCSAAGWLGFVPADSRRCQFPTQGLIYFRALVHQLTLQRIILLYVAIAIVAASSEGNRG